jgi:signal transduction histidine kinase
MYMLLLVGACSLPFYYIPHPDYDHIANLVGTVGYWGLLVALLLGASYILVAHATLLWSIGYVAYLAAMTGGINSPVMVWMTVAILPAILLLERAPAMFWVIVVFVANFALLLISQHGLVNSDINMANDVMAWTVANKLFVLGLALYVVFVTERMHRSQTVEMDESNAELERTHQALIRAQAHKDEFIASVGHELRSWASTAFYVPSLRPSQKTPLWWITSAAQQSSCYKSSMTFWIFRNCKRGGWCCTKKSLHCVKHWPAY